MKQQKFSDVLHDDDRMGEIKLETKGMVTGKAGAVMRHRLILAVRMKGCARLKRGRIRTR